MAAPCLTLVSGFPCLLLFTLTLLSVLIETCAGDAGNVGKVHPNLPRQHGQWHHCPCLFYFVSLADFLDISSRHLHPRRSISVSSIFSLSVCLLAHDALLVLLQPPRR